MKGQGDTEILWNPPLGKMNIQISRVFWDLLLCTEIPNVQTDWPPNLWGHRTSGAKRLGEGKCKEIVFLFIEAYIKDRKQTKTHNGEINKRQAILWRYNAVYWT